MGDYTAAIWEPASRSAGAPAVGWTGPCSADRAPRWKEQRRNPPGNPERGQCDLRSILSVRMRGLHIEVGCHWPEWYRTSPHPPPPGKGSAGSRSTASRTPAPEGGPSCVQPLLSAMLCTRTPPVLRCPQLGLPAWAWAAWLSRTAPSCPAGFWVSPQHGQCSLAYFGGEQPRSPEMGGSDNQLRPQPLAPSSADVGFSRFLQGQQPAGALP